MRPRQSIVSADSQGCVRFEPTLTLDSCAPCGACCREGFDRVELQRGELRRARPALRALVVVDVFGPHVPRPHGTCVALAPVQHAASAAYRCSIYADRPTACADFAVGSDACLTARKRVGLSP